MTMPLETFPSKPEALTQTQRVVSEKVSKFIVKKDIKVNFVWIHMYKNTFLTGFYILISFLLLDKIYFFRHEVCFYSFTNKS